MWEIEIGKWTVQIEPMLILLIFGILATIYVLIGFGRIWRYVRDIRDTLDVIERRCGNIK